MSWINKVSTIASKIFVLSSSEPTSNTHVEMRELVDDWNLCFFSGKKEVNLWHYLNLSLESVKKSKLFLVFTCKFRLTF